MSDPTSVKISPERFMESIPKTDGYPRRVVNTPCWVDKREDTFVALIPVPHGSSAQNKAWEDMCRRHLAAWLRNEPERVTQVVFVLSHDSAQRVVQAQEKRLRRASKRVGARVL